MKAVVYKGPRELAVEEVPDARIEDPTDALIRITTTNICGSDLHMYEGRTDVEAGTVLGHENMGVVEDVGSAVGRVSAGDRVSVPFNIACGTCRSCNEGWTSFCERTNPIDGMQGAAYGYANMGPYPGGQAEYLRVPYADFNLLDLPSGDEHENDFTTLSDIFPTGWHGTRLSGLEPGDTVAVFGAGPVGLLAAHSARLQGARGVYVVDHQRDRLALVERFECAPIDATKGDPVEQIMDATAGLGVDRGVEAVGWQAHDPQGDEDPAMVLDELAQVVKAHGGIGVVGVYVPEDPGGPNELAQQGRPAWSYGTFFSKGQQMATGQAPVKRYNRQLRDLIIDGRAKPSELVSHELDLTEAVDAYDKFDKRLDGWTKVLLRPSA
ncbi:MAG: glutathione-independent formaldehyde dehydrogenase [Nocardioides sp.]|nr:glutathione-independent formaldehyde dehydrogenase [Nocardioides sp.]